ncbi:MAG: FkbM family methyltransferase [Thermoprotei archaeon]
MAFHTRALRSVMYVNNWYEIPLYHLGLRRNLVVKMKNGLKFLYIPGAFNLEQFVEQPYRMLDVSGKIVVDVGAFNGDSSICFSRRGAKWVYAFEPYPRLYSVAKENLRLNGVVNVDLFNEAVDSYDGYIKLDPEYKPKSSSSARDFGYGVIIRVKSLDALVTQLGISGAVLKLDCEGCEYNLILNSQAKTLSAFQQIILEYHYRGHTQLTAKLTECGFTVQPLDIRGRPCSGQPERLGLLYAVKSV